MSHGLSKSRLLSFLQCPKRLWLQVYRPQCAAHIDQGTATLARGRGIGELAHSLYPGGKVIEAECFDEAHRKTIRILWDHPGRPIFEAAVAYDDVVVRVDVLQPHGTNFRLIEVKASTSVKDYHLRDCAVKAWVCSGAGFPLTQVLLTHIETGFVYPGGGDYRGLLRTVDVTQQIAALLPEVPRWVTRARATLATAAPMILPGAQCSEPFDCPFIKHCHRALAKDGTLFPVESLPQGGNLIAELLADGYRDLREVPAERLTRPQHQRMRRAAQSRKAEFDPVAADELRALPYPRYYIDFETIQFAVPIWAGMHPYQQVGFQWSCHRERAPGEQFHSEFLKDDGEDPRRDFAEALIEAVGEDGAVIVYNAGFEGTIIRQLAADLPDLTSPLHAIAARLFDLLPLTRQHYYHPYMQGSWSIKSVLPTIAPELDYVTLAVQHGAMAQEAYLELITAETPPARRAELRESLLRYCHTDTLAAVRIAWHLAGRTVSETSDDWRQDG
ncbi:DUF2779 domain-containing protein [Methylolobus aquaticus]|nr:DUF2779 domain-containing protein [Methylolobus aquaticus]